ncbi:protein kinase domain-containing protein [Haematococcus lacustris]|uniref:Protein kinase domain-containing protein n=1 Tax=Haematococcus lacustris TaxID=44745 RepID=A0A699Z6B8_HAELA|nr:protein kinase domain-containing protein [Haematococcus lacustris]
MAIDLSPANILLKLDDSRPGCLKAVAKVGDFGLSHMSKDGQSHVSNVRQGTPFYTAPELEMRPKLFDVVKLLLVQQQELVKALAANKVPA